MFFFRGGGGVGCEMGGFVAAGGGEREGDVHTERGGGWGDVGM